MTNIPPTDTDDSDKYQGAAKPLSPKNALVLVDEFEALVVREKREQTDPRAREAAKRILSSLRMAPGPRDEIEALLSRILAWTEVLFTDQTDAGPGSVQTSIKRGLAELRTLIAAAAEEGVPPGEG